MTITQEKLRAAFPEFPWKFDAPLAPLTYLKIGGPAEALVALSSIKDVQKLVQFTNSKSIRLTVLGGASNVVISDAGIKGVVVTLALTECTKVTSEVSPTLELIRVGAGCKMALLVAQTVQWGYQGLEYFLGVPGTIGGAIYNNAHYLSDLIGEHVHAVRVITDSGKLEWIPQEKCEFAYEKSRFQTTKEIIVEVDFALKPGNQKESQEKIKRATEYRAKTQPLGVPSSGCVFQNVANTPALRKRFPQFADKTHVPGGFIIDQASLKGERVGGISVSTKHAAWFVNDGTGTSQDVKALINHVKTRVKAAFDVELHEEVFYLE